MRKRVYVLGIIVGIIAPIFGLFLGLQAPPILGTILTAPLILLTIVTGDALGNLSGLMRIVGILISIGLWTAIFALIDKLVQKKKPA